MTIRNRELYNQSAADWAMLAGCFGTSRGSNGVCDIDGVKEWHGVCLFLEHKLPGGRVSMAQDIAFDSLRCQGNTVIVFWGRAPDGTDLTCLRIYAPGGPNFPPDEPASLDDVRAAAQRWFRAADARPRKRRYG